MLDVVPVYGMVGQQLKMLEDTGRLLLLTADFSGVLMTSWKLAWELHCWSVD